VTTEEERAPIKVLVVEDERSFADALTIGLSSRGFSVEHMADGPSALAGFDEVAPDIVLLDVMLPGMSGIDVCRELRRKSSVPILMVTALNEEIDTVVGLEVGADDYVTKPYRMRELVARMRSALRRFEATETSEPSDDGESMEMMGIALDRARREVTRNDELVALPRKEFDLLGLLLANAGRVMTREVLIERIWGWDYEGDTKTLDVHIKRLRQKLEGDPSKPELIVTVRGVGYKFNDSASNK